MIQNMKATQLEVWKGLLKSKLMGLNSDKVLIESKSPVDGAVGRQEVGSIFLQIKLERSQVDSFRKLALKQRVQTVQVLDYGQPSIRSRFGDSDRRGNRIPYLQL